MAFCRCSTGVALHPLKILVSHLPPLCREVSHRNLVVSKGVALHGGVAATVAGVALHCATKDGKSLLFWWVLLAHCKPIPPTLGGAWITFAIQKLIKV